MRDKFSQRIEDAKTALSEEDVEQAIAQLTAAVFLQPSEPQPYVLRGEALAKLCDFHSAVINYRKALQLTSPLAAERVPSPQASLPAHLWRPADLAPGRPLTPPHTRARAPRTPSWRGWPRCSTCALSP